MHEYLETQLHCTILAWDDPEETPFVVVHNGELILADTLQLLLAVVMGSPQSLAA